MEIKDYFLIGLGIVLIIVNIIRRIIKNNNKQVLLMKTSPLCDKEYSNEAVTCSDCGGKLIDKKKAKAVDVAGDIVEAVIECVIDAIT